jgi:DNA-binding NtrC family response regulator
MSLRNFFSEHREELLRACKTELNGETSIEQLARELCDLLEPPSGNQLEPPTGATTLLGDDPAIKRVRASIEQLARRSRIPVLFLGELGTGKRHSARILHDSTYPDGEFFELRNDEQLPLLERRIAALRVPSSRQAMAGISVYVNEPSGASKAVQAVLAKLLGEHGLRFRLMASSPLPLTTACREGLLRSDLVFGFSTTVELPNLRDRPADLPVLLAHFASQRSNRTRAPLVFSDAALSVLASHPWPGNLIELSQLVERLQRLDATGMIEPEHLTELGHRRSGIVVSLPPGGIDLANLERELLLQALAASDNNRSRAARLLGLTRDQIRYRLSKLDMACGSDVD